MASYVYDAYWFKVGWNLNKLVAALKDNTKEVTLTLKKRPRHVTLYGPHAQRKKVPKNVKQSTFPKAFRRKSREEKSLRAPLKDFLNSMPTTFNKDRLVSPSMYILYTWRVYMYKHTGMCTGVSNLLYQF